MISPNFTHSALNFDSFASNYSLTNRSSQTTYKPSLGFIFEESEEENMNDFKFYFENKPRLTFGKEQESMDTLTYSLGSNAIKQDSEYFSDLSHSFWSASPAASIDDQLAAIAKTITFSEVDLNKYVEDLLESTPITCADNQSVIAPVGVTKTHGKRMRKSIYQTKILTQEF